MLWVDWHTDSCTASQEERESVLSSLVSEEMENLLEDNDEL